MKHRTKYMALLAFFTSISLVFSEDFAQGRDLQDVTFVSFDTETTGLSPKKERIVEIGAVKFKNGKVLEKKSWLLNPGKPIPHYVSRIHGIDDEAVKDAPAFAEVVEAFEGFIGDAVLVAHNAPFDVNMLSAEYQRCGRPFPKNRVIDSLKLSRLWYPDLKSHKLGSMAEHLGITKGTFHRALDDSDFLARIFIVSTEQQHPAPTLETLFKLVEKPTPFKTIELKPLSGS